MATDQYPSIWYECHWLHMASQAVKAAVATPALVLGARPHAPWEIPDFLGAPDRLKLGQVSDLVPTYSN